MKGLSLLIVLLGWAINASAVCPKFVFYCDNPNRCDGQVDISIMMCTDGVSDPISIDYIVWNMGNGFSDTTTALNYTYNYTAGGTYNITATVYCTVGEQRCIVQSLVLGASTPQTICTAPNLGTTLQVPVTVFDFSIYVSSPTPPTAIYDNTSVTLGGTYTGNLSSASYTLYVDGVLQPAFSGSGTFPSTIYTGSLTPGQHLVEMMIQDKGTACTFVRSLVIEVQDRIEIPECLTCFTFRPLKGERYWLSAWIKADITGVKTYTNLGMFAEISYTGNTSVIQLFPSGEIIEGWQRVTGEFTVPLSPEPTEIKVAMVNTHTSVDAYFDDVRIHPYNANMKSYVTDDKTFWLLAELNEENYATFYEYDKEGQLIRTKKETANGTIITINEARENNPKVN